MAAERIKVGVARSALLENGATFFDPAALGILDATPEIDWEYLTDPVRRLTADHCAAYDVICAVSEGIGPEALGQDRSEAVTTVADGQQGERVFGSMTSPAIGNGLGRGGRGEGAFELVGNDEDAERHRPGGWAGRGLLGKLGERRIGPQRCQSGTVGRNVMAGRILSQDETGARRGPCSGSCLRPVLEAWNNEALAE